jgi:hypothetical protein
MQPGTIPRHGVDIEASWKQVMAVKSTYLNAPQVDALEQLAKSDFEHGGPGWIVLAYPSRPAIRPQTVRSLAEACAALDGLTAARRHASHKQAAKHYLTFRRCVRASEPWRRSSGKILRPGWTSRTLGR